MTFRKFLIAAAAAMIATAMPVASPAQDFPVEFLKMSAMRRQAPVPSANAIASYAAAAQLAPETKRAVEGLLAEARAADARGDTSAAQLALAHARALLDGKPWSPAQAFASSLEVAPKIPLIDVAAPLQLTVSRAYAAQPAAARLRVSAQAPGKAPVQLSEVPLSLRKSGDTVVTVNLPKTLEGRADLVSEIVVGGQALASSSERVDFVSDLAGIENRTEARLKAVKASDEAVAVVRYPFQVAKLVRAGEREIEARAFSDRLERSQSVLAALESGKDPVLRGVGDQDRAYWFAEPGEYVPYRIYVPTTWDRTQKLPVIVALHGGGGDENGMFERESSGKFQKLAERYGYIVVSPLGYRPLGAYGSPIRLPSVYGTDIKEGREVGGPERAKLLALSEQDVLNVLEKVVTEYGADRSRVYLTGHSMGGGGTWYLAHQHPELWNAIAASAGPFFIDGYDFERLRKMGIMIVQGSGDPPSLNADRQLARDLLERGFGVNYVETPSVNHGQTFGNNLPTIFEFFERQKLRDHPDVPLPLR